MTAIGAGLANPTQVAENLPSSIVGALSMLGGGPSEDLHPKYGVVFRFKVELDELNGNADLGNWQSCGGLKMDFAPLEVKSGGNYMSVQYLPNEVKYPKVVLKRAVEPTSSRAVQDWLSQAAASWINGTERDNPGGAVITMLDRNGRTLLTWHLNRVRPASWSGPDLDANTSKVAIETLELVHEGFHVSVGSGTTTADPFAGQTSGGGGLVLAKDTGSPGGGGGGGRGGMGGHRRPATPWRSASPTALARTGPDSIRFYNYPQKVSVERTTDVVPAAAATQAAADEGANAGIKTGTTKLKMADLYLVKDADTDLVRLIDELVYWMGTQSDNSRSRSRERKPADLVLTWGPNFSRKVTLTGLTAEYIRFLPDGTPTRAKVTLTLTVKPERPNRPTNPSSGGIPGRGSHLLIMDENLPLLAHEHYGSSARWRDIAEANGIDDPLRAGPGTAVFLPAPTELSGKGGAR